MVELLGFVAFLNADVLSNKGAGQGIPIPVVIWGVVVMGMAYIVNRTVFGRHWHAIGGNPQAALSGDSGTVFGPSLGARIIQYLE